MSMGSPKIQALARQLLTFEAAHVGTSDKRVNIAVRVIEELRARLIKLAGAEGFRALLSRALTLSKAEVPSLSSVVIGENGSLEGFDETEESRETEQAGIYLVARLLELLVTFIGESLTLHLVRDAWPEASIDGLDLRTEDKP